MEGQEGVSVRELLALSVELRHKSEVLRERLRDTEAEAQNLRAYAMWWVRRQSTMLPCYALPRPPQNGSSAARRKPDEADGHLR